MSSQSMEHCGRCQKQTPAKSGQAKLFDRSRPNPSTTLGHAQSSPICPRRCWVKEKTTNSIATGFSPLPDVGEFVGRNWTVGLLIIFFCLTSRIVLTTSVSWSRLDLVCLTPISNHSHTSAARPTWRCKNGPHARSRQDVCKCLCLIRWLASILCTLRCVGTAEGLSHSCSSNNPSLGDNRVVLQLSRSEHHGVFLFGITKHGKVSALNFLLGRPSSVYSVGIR